MKNFGVHGKIQFLGRVHEKPVYKEGLPKKGGWGLGSFQI